MTRSALPPAIVRGEREPLTQTWQCQDAIMPPACRDCVNAMIPGAAIPRDRPYAHGSELDAQAFVGVDLAGGRRSD